jgi:quercetin dioxygenase-like cupin family protein
MHGYLLRSGDGVSDEDLAVKATADRTGGALSVVEAHLTAGAGPHIHKNEDIAFYVLDGVLTVRCGDDIWEADRGCFAYLPRDVCHSWDVHTISASLLIISTPPADADERQLAAPDAAGQETFGIVWC